MAGQSAHAGSGALPRRPRAPLVQEHEVPGLADARDLYKRGLITKEGGREAMDHYFHQVSQSDPAASGPREEA